MCGRVNACASIEDVARASRVDGRDATSSDARDVAGSRRNVSPGSSLPVVRAKTMTRKTRVGNPRETSDDGRETLTLTSMVWGVPLRSRASRGTERGVDAVDEGEGGDDGGGGWIPRTYNARVEGLDGDVPQFSRLAERDDRRCVMYVDGFYEWRTEGPRGRGVKQPYLVRRSYGAPMALAGVFERKKSVAADEEKVDLTNEEAVIVTMSSAHGDLEWLHDRQPMVLSTDEDFDAWMFGDWRGVASTRTAKDLAGVFAWHPVTTRMNVADYSGEDAPKKVKRAVEKDAGSIASMFAAAKKRKTET